jgi:hypothetical protein
MQAVVLRSRCGCSESDQKAWVRDGVLIPVAAGAGPGIHAEYDEANVLAAAIASHMKRSHIVVRRYAKAFAQLQLWLRARSALEWPRFTILLSPDALSVTRTGDPLATDASGFMMNLASIYGLVRDSSQTGQLPLDFGLSLVGEGGGR